MHLFNSEEQQPQWDMHTFSEEAFYQTHCGRRLGDDENLQDNNPR